MRHALLALALAGILAAPAAYSQSLPQSQPGGIIRMEGALLTVSAEAEVKSAPDLAAISFGVLASAPTAEAAMAENARRMSASLAALKKAGVAEKDVQTSGLALSPQFAYRDNEAPRLTGYQVSNTANVIFRDLKALGRTLDAVVAAGSNQLNGVSFGLDKPDAAQDQARRDAMAKARARAELYAQAAGLKVARIVSISEGGASPVPAPMAIARAASADMASAIEPGEVGVSASITVQFELR